MKPKGGRQQTATQVKVSISEILIDIEVDLLYSQGRQHCLGRYGKEKAVLSESEALV